LPGGKKETPVYAWEKGRATKATLFVDGKTVGGKLETRFEEKRISLRKQRKSRYSGGGKRRKRFVRRRTKKT